jgi:alkylation response protein AidB-like acyl-CoA dehydrogenase
MFSEEPIHAIPGDVMTQAARWNDEDLAAFEAGLTPENLTAIMRSTWTWDDRALRRDLARLLTSLRAVDVLDSGSDVHQLVRRRTLHDASLFLAAVLGPRVVADAGHETSFSFSDTLIRSPWLSGGLDDERLLRAVGAQTVEGATTDPLNLAQALAQHGLSASGDQGAGAEYLSKIEVGALSATLAAAEASGSWDPALVRTRATLEGPQWLLDGEKYFVPHADTADVLLVIARSTAGQSLFAVEASAPGWIVSEMPGIDPTRPLARLQLHKVPAVLIGVEGAGGRLMGRTLDLATVSLAEEQVMGARRCLELGASEVDRAAWQLGEVRLYSELRVQVEVAQAMWEHARQLADADTAESSIAAAMAHVCCSEAFAHVARATLQLVGETRDDVIAEATGLFLRAQSSDLLFGGPALYYERLLDRMGI